jgi:hypothetical protein
MSPKTKVKAIFIGIGITAFIVLFVIYREQFLWMLGLLVLLFLGAIALVYVAKQRGSRHYDDTSRTYESGQYQRRPPRQKICRYCHGSGEMRGPLGRRDCPHCNGVGYYYVD